jgi:hypothetical protein
MGDGATVRLSVGQLVAEGSDFVRDAWRECWLPMLLAIAGHTLMFVDQHVPAAEWSPGPLAWIAPLLMIFYVPLYGALYRSALGGHPAASRGPGGLQWSAVEWRLIAVGVVIAFLTGLAMTPFSAITGIAALLLHNGVFSAGPFGQWARWTPFAILIWAVFFWLFAPRIARLMLGWPFSIARERTQPFAGFIPSRGSGWAIAFALALCFVPLLLGWLAFYAIGLIEADVISGVYWPLPEAVGVGLLLGSLKAGVVAPLIVGVLSGGYWLLEGDRLAEESDESEVKPPHINLFGLAEAAVAAAAALAAKEAAEHALIPYVDDHPEEAPSAGDDDADEAGSEAEQAAAAAAETNEHTEHAAHDAAAAAAEEAAEDAHTDPVPDAVDSAPEPEALPPQSGGAAPLSPWPHSVLPPWPAHVRGFEPAPTRAVLTAAAVADKTEAPAPADSLASGADPAHPSTGVTESG